jgi:hypothetical protein
MPPINFKCVQQQYDTSDHGVFAMAFAILGILQYKLEYTRWSYDFKLKQ